MSERARKLREYANGPLQQKWQRILDDAGARTDDELREKLAPAPSTALQTLLSPVIEPDQSYFRIREYFSVALRWQTEAVSVLKAGGVEPVEFERLKNTSINVGRKISLLASKGFAAPAAKELPWTWPSAPAGLKWGLLAIALGLAWLLFRR